MWRSLVRSANVVGAVLSLTVLLRATSGGIGEHGRFQEDTLRRVLSAVTAYLESYDHDFSAVVSEETYEQSGHGPKGVVTGHRITRSDLLLLNSGEAGWLCFRDVFEVDGKPVRDRSQRLMELFQQSTPDSIVEATKIREEGARFNIGGLSRTVNDPALALTFVRPANQRRSSFELSGQTTVAGLKTRLLKFREDAIPHLIQTADGSPASGRLWVDEATGRIVRTELVLSTDDARGVITVAYASQAKLAGLWVPVRMEEHYTIGSSRIIECVATYSNFRRFQVSIGLVQPPSQSDRWSP